MQFLLGMHDMEFKNVIEKDSLKIGSLSVLSASLNPGLCGFYICRCMEIVFIKKSENFTQFL